MAFKFSNHAWVMVLCCAIPLVLLAAVYFFNLDKKYLAWLVILLCPLMHYLLMRDMHKKHSGTKSKACH